MNWHDVCVGEGEVFVREGYVMYRSKRREGRYVVKERVRGREV